MARKRRSVIVVRNIDADADAFTLWRNVETECRTRDHPCGMHVMIYLKPAEQPLFVRRRDSVALELLDHHAQDVWRLGIARIMLHTKRIVVTSLLVQLVDRLIQHELTNLRMPYH